MNYENLIVEKGNHIGFIKINRPEVRNALNNETVTEILSAFEELENDQEIGVDCIYWSWGKGICSRSGYKPTNNEKSNRSI